MDDKVIITTSVAATVLPVFVCDLSAIRSHLLLAKEGIEDIRAQHPETTPSNVHSSYMSPWKSHLESDKFAPLCNSVTVIANYAAERFMSANLKQLNLDLVVTDCWGAIYEKSDYTERHNHFPADMSCSIYIEADENAAPIIFSNDLKVHPKPNMLVLFPGILDHEVPATEGRRVIVAMNLTKRATFNDFLTHTTDAQ